MWSWKPSEGFRVFLQEIPGYSALKELNSIASSWCWRKPLIWLVKNDREAPCLLITVWESILTHQILISFYKFTQHTNHKLALNVWVTKESKNLILNEILIDVKAMFVNLLIWKMKAFYFESTNGDDRKAFNFFITPYNKYANMFMSCWEIKYRFSF